MRVDNPTGLVEEGHALPFSPELSGNLLIVKDIDLGGNTLILQTDMQYRDESFTDVFDLPVTNTYDEVFEVNARVTYIFGDAEQYSISAFGQNLTGEEYCNYEQDLFAFSGAATCLPNDGEPLFGIEGRVEF